MEGGHGGDDRPSFAQHLDSRFRGNDGTFLLEGSNKLSQISADLPVGREIPLNPPFSKGGGSGLARF